MEDISHDKAKFLPNPDIPREQCVPECQGCNKMFSDGNIGDVCIAYINPKEKNRLGCGLKSNRELTVEEKKKINPIKWSKRKNRR